METWTGTLDRDLLDTLDHDLLDLAWKHFVSLTCDLLVPARASIKGYGKFVTFWLGFLAVSSPFSITTNASNLCLSDEVLSMNTVNSSSVFHSVRRPPLSHRPSLMPVRFAEIVGILVRVWPWSALGFFNIHVACSGGFVKCFG